MANQDYSANKDCLPWLLMPCILLTLCSVTLLAPRHSAQAAVPMTATAKPVFSAAKAETYDDGDGDELLEHWGDPKYSREERVQMAGGAAGFLLLFGCTWGKRAAKKHYAQHRAQSQPHAEREAHSEECDELRKAA